MRVLAKFMLCLIVTPLLLFATDFSYLQEDEVVIGSSHEEFIDGTSTFSVLVRDKGQTSDRVEGVGLVFLQNLNSAVLPINTAYFPKARFDILVGTSNFSSFANAQRYVSRTGVIGFSESENSFADGILGNPLESADNGQNANNFEIFAKFVSGNLSVGDINMRTIDISPSLFANSNGASSGLAMKTDGVRGFNGINTVYWDSTANYVEVPTATLEVWGDVAATHILGPSGTGKSPLMYGLNNTDNITTQLESTQITFTPPGTLTISAFPRADALARGRDLHNSSLVATYSVNITGFSDTGVLSHDTQTEAKTFTIQHPVDASKYLVHAMLEAPESRVYYRGSLTLKNGVGTVTLPDYFEALTAQEGRMIQLSSPDSFDLVAVRTQQGKRIVNGQFNIYSENPISHQTVHWEVSAIRQDVAPLVVEPKTSDVTVYGEKPYRYYKIKK